MKALILRICGLESFHSGKGQPPPKLPLGIQQVNQSGIQRLTEALVNPNQSHQKVYAQYGSPIAAQTEPSPSQDPAIRAEKTTSWEEWLAIQVESPLTLTPTASFWGEVNSQWAQLGQSVTMNGYSWAHEDGDSLVTPVRHILRYIFQEENPWLSSGAWENSKNQDTCVAILIVGKGKTLLGTVLRLASLSGWHG